MNRIETIIAIAIVGQLLLVPATQAQITRGDIDELRREGEAKNWTFTVAETEGTLRPHHELCGLLPPLERQPSPPQEPLPARDLPAQFNWCDMGGCTSVKNQGGCGACWAFATVGILESNILLNDDLEVDLSEQWLVSCNTDNMTCGGGWFCSRYHMATGDSCGESGAVFESDFPYAAQDLPCGCPYTHVYWVDNWAYVPGGDIPPVSEIKQAIVNFGPVATAICTPPEFHAYNGGVFNACDDPGALDHGVIIVGWDDNLGTEGAWRIRNSWGTNWGEDGYMWIEYGCIQVGNGANYVVYPGTVWVDFAYFGTEVGTFTQPFNTLAEGVSAVPTRGHVRIKAGSTSAIGTITKAMTIHSYNGTAVVGE